jgi:thioredoxin reductase (NADPH)
MKTLDVVIIGAGPIGLACGIEAKKSGLNYIILEKGCLVNSLYNYPANMSFFSTSERLEIGGVPFISNNAKPLRSEALEYYRRVCASHQLQVRLYEKVESIAKTNAVFELKTTKGEYKASVVILALGFYDLPYLLQVPGEELPKVKHYYDEPHPYYAQKVMVIGAANSAVDAALETWRKGADVTMIIRESTLRESVKYWAKPDIENRINEGSIKAYFNAHVLQINEDSVLIKTPEGEKLIENDFVLAMTGYQPPFDFLKSAGVKFHNDGYHTPIYDQNTMETNVTGLYLAGVVCGGLKTNKWFVENSRVHAEMIMQHLTSKWN